MKKDLKDLKVVIVDDNKMGLEVIKDYCESFGMDVVYWAYSATEILEWLSTAEQLPDFILSDIMMPEINGCELAETIKKDDRYKKIKLIAVTFDVSVGIGSLVQDSGFDGFLPRPFNEKELQGVIEGVTV